jgi:hypothetical protein
LSAGGKGCVTDDKGWASPAGSAPKPSASPWTAPEAAAAGARPAETWQQQAAPVWTPPPKPGLIPLRPLSFGTIIGSSFRVMRRNPAPTFGLAVLFYGVITIVYFTVMASVYSWAISRVQTASSSDQADLVAGNFGAFVLAALVPSTLAVVAAAMLQGFISLEVSRATLGEKLKIRGLWRLAKGRIGRLLLWSVAQSIAMLVLMLLATLVTVGVFSAAASSSSASAVLAGAVFAVLVSVVVSAVFLAAGVWLGTKLSLVPSAILLERMTVLPAMRRSWRLTKSNFWRTFGIQVLIYVIINVGTSVITTPILLVGSIVAGLINPNGDDSAGLIGFAVVAVIAGVVSVVLGATGLVMQSASLALIYIDIRMRKEGLDLELMHYVEAKQSGAKGVANPYLPA